MTITDYDYPRSVVGKHSFLHHRYLVGLALTPQHQNPGSMPGEGARGQNLVHIQKIGLLL